MKNSYTIKNPKKFTGKSLDENDLMKAINFAYDMIYGEGHHRYYRSGGTLHRKKGEQFCNTFQGKIAEIALHNHLVQNYPKLNVSIPDFNIWGKGIWDDTDLILNEKVKVNIKSMAFFSNLLLLETKDWNKEGAYIPNLTDENKALYDYFVVVRIQPDTKSLFQIKKWFYNDDKMSKEKITDYIRSHQWSYDIAGCASLKTIQHLINNKDILEKGSLINESTKLDASNYFCEVSRLHSIDKMVEKIC